MANTKEYNARYWAEHRTELLAKKKRAYEKDPAKVRERNKRWLDANRDKWNAYMRERRRKAKLDKGEGV